MVFSKATFIKIMNYAELDEGPGFVRDECLVLLYKFTFLIMLSCRLGTGRDFMNGLT